MGEKARRSLRHKIAHYRRLRRLLFISPAEAQFIRVMRGRVVVVPWIRDRRTKFPFAIVLSMGYLKRELVRREVRVGRYFLDFAVETPFYKRGIEIDGQRYHDVLKDQERDAYLEALGWRIKRIPARRVFREPRVVYVETLRHLRS